MAATTKSVKDKPVRGDGSAEDVVLPFRQQDDTAVVRTAVDLFDFNMRLARDVLSGAITPSVCRAASMATGTAIKALDLQYRLGNKPMLPVAS